MRKPKEWGQPCPNPACGHYKLMNRGNVKAIATYETRSGKRRIFQCRECGEQFSETRDTVFFDLRTPEEKVMIVLKLLLCKVELTAISFALGVSEETSLEWLRRAAEKADEINQHLLREVEVTQVELDELWSFVLRKRATGAESNGESPEESSEGRQWVWVSFAPEYRLLLATYVGPRTFQSALKLIQLTAAVVLGVPVFFSDGFSCYLSALVEVYHQLKTFAHTGKRGRPKKPLKEPHPDLVYAQLVKHKQQGRLQEAEELLRQALETTRRTMGDESPATISSLNSLGVLLGTRGKYAESEPYLRESLETSRRVRVSDAGAGTFAWSPVSNELLFMNARGVYSVAFETDPFTPATPELLHVHPEGRVLGWWVDLPLSGDADRVLGLISETSGGAASPHIKVVLNWFTELRAALGNED